MLLAKFAEWIEKCKWDRFGDGQLQGNIITYSYQWKHKNNTYELVIEPTVEGYNLVLYIIRGDWHVELTEAPFKDLGGFRQATEKLLKYYKNIIKRGINIIPINLFS